MALARAIVRGDRMYVSALLSRAPDIVLARFAVGASRQASEDYFLAEIEHYLYRGDSALHVAAAAFEADIVRELIDGGAPVCALNRRGAQPLHYAVDGTPGSARWKPAAQRETVLCLIELALSQTPPTRMGPCHCTARSAIAARLPSARCSMRALILAPRMAVDRRPGSSRTAPLAAREAGRLRPKPSKRRSSSCFEPLATDDRT